MAYELMRGVGNLCTGADSDPDYDARRMAEPLIAGLRRTETEFCPVRPDVDRQCGSGSGPDRYP